MFEENGQPTVKYKSVTIVTNITIIYTIREDESIFTCSQDLVAAVIKIKFGLSFSSGFVPFHGFQH